MSRALYLILAVIPVLLIPVMGCTWLIFSIYALMLYLKEPLQQRYEKLPGAPTVKYFIVFLLFGLLTETFAIIDNLPRHPNQRILLNPAPFTDLYLALGYYGGFALVWSMVRKKFRFTHTEVFLIGGIFGIVFEQTGKLLLSLQIFAWPYVFLVYGSFQAIPALLAEKENKACPVNKYWKIGMGILTEFACFVSAGLFLYLLSIPLQ
ncbi:MAG: hypothetical protein GXO25_01385 [Euryarchaeota archaeon]|nr:hypothetical protein [Euryarchaeota archaeon]